MQFVLGLVMNSSIQLTFKLRSISWAISDCKILKLLFQQLMRRKIQPTMHDDMKLEIGYWKVEYYYIYSGWQCPPLYDMQNFGDAKVLQK
jgi:hypothetical protein